jgi:hypothetical protein
MHQVIAVDVVIVEFPISVTMQISTTKNGS